MFLFAKLINQKQFDDIDYSNSGVCPSLVNPALKPASSSAATTTTANKPTLPASSTPAVATAGQRSRRLASQRGLSLVETLVVTAIGLALIAVAVKVYSYFVVRQIDLRSVAKVDEQVSQGVFAASQDVLLSAGANMGYFNGFEYAAARRVGSSNSIVTPLKINGRDGVIILTSSPKSPRLEIVSTTTVSGNTGIAKVSTANLPSSPAESTVDSVSLTAQLPAIGSLALIIGGPGVDPSKVTANSTSSTLPTNFNDIVSEARLVKITNIRSVVETAGLEQLPLQEITMNLCTSGQCSEQLPLVTNLPVRTVFEPGNVIVPLRVLTLYYRNGVLVENEGGVLTTNGGQTQVIGGQDLNLTPINDFNLRYELNDGTIKSAAEVTNALDKIIAVEVVPRSQTQTLATKRQTSRQTLRRLEIKARVLEVLQ